MPSGEVHIDYWKKLRIVSAPAAIVPAGLVWAATTNSFLAGLAGAFSILGYLLGYFIDPDLDQIGMTSGEGRLMRKFGCFGFAIVWWFMPYGYFFKHRSFLTHAPLLSTVIRLTWLLAPLAYPGYRLLQINPTLGTPLACALTGLLIGLSLSDLIHIALDRA